MLESFKVVLILSWVFLECIFAYASIMRLLTPNFLLTTFDSYVQSLPTGFVPFTRLESEQNTEF